MTFLRISGEPDGDRASPSFTGDLHTEPGKSLPGCPHAVTFRAPWFLRLVWKILVAEPFHQPRGLGVGLAGWKWVWPAQVATLQPGPFWSPSRV